MVHDRVDVLFALPDLALEPSSARDQPGAREPERVPDPDARLVRGVDEVEHAPAVPELRTVVQVCAAEGRPDAETAVDGRDDEPCVAQVRGPAGVVGLRWVRTGESVSRASLVSESPLSLFGALALTSANERRPASERLEEETQGSGRESGVGQRTEHSEDAFPIRPSCDHLIKRQARFSLESVCCACDSGRSARVQDSEEAVGG